MLNDNILMGQFHRISFIFVRKRATAAATEERK